MPGLATYSTAQSEANMQRYNVPDGFDVLSRALDAAVYTAAPAAKEGGFDVAARQYWGEEPQFEKSNGSSTRSSGFDLLDQAQEGVIDGEATEEGLRTAAAMLAKRQAGLAEVPSKATKASATSDGFGLVENVWPRFSPCRPGKSVAH